MKIKTAEFITSAVKPSQFPETGLNEIAFAGRSNAGKSSLINKVLNRKKLVKTSSSPGKTRLINYFCVNDEFYFVDLPGYGYAKVSAKEQKEWGPMVVNYLTRSISLQCVVLVMDSRRTPKIEELDLVNWLKTYDIPVLYVLTKTDKLKKNDIKKCLVKNAKMLGVAEKEVLMFSAKSGLGREAFWNRIEEFLKYDDDISEGIDE